MGGPIPILESSCFGCCSLEVGAKIVAWIKLVSVIALNIAVLTGIILVGIGKIHEEDLPQDFRGKYLILGCALISAISVLFLILAVLLIIGVYKRRPAYIIPWMVFCVILLINGALELMILFFKEFTLYTIERIIYEVTLGYMTLLIYSYFQEIRREGPTYVQNL
ncbi:uncharacterized protein LOC142331745 [Lycorma delicatula]|uniref:uncharacterized protein LOC142331745 n=1 Tax=Lycorma delicatula TaxID=130591 RepID=UPI003F516007